MKRINSTQNGLFITLVCAAAIMTASLLHPQSVLAQATCTRWDASGPWVFVQTNDTSPRFTLQQTGTGLQGSASYSKWVEDDWCIGVNCDHLETVSASVDGEIRGDSVDITAYWNNGTTGVYTGRIDSRGRMQGSGYDRQHPQTIANWYSDRTARCVAGGTGDQIRTTSSGLSIVPPPPAPLIGTLGTSPSNYQPIWLYGIRSDGYLAWYRKDTGTSSWQGPKRAGSGWDFKDVIPAGGNNFYALSEDGKLIWYQHTGFNDGTREWKGPVEVGRGWTFAKIFSGGEGIIYAITQDGKLRWYKHNGYVTGSGLATPGAWDGPKEVGRGWNGFEQVFSGGGGIIYVITDDGKLRWYRHNGYLTGAGVETPGAWDGPKEVGRGWNGFRQIVPAGAGVILVIQNDGKLRWYRHNGYLTGSGAETPGSWEGPTEVGTGWHSFKKVIAVLPVTASAPVVR